MSLREPYPQEEDDFFNTSSQGGLKTPERRTQSSNSDEEELAEEWTIGIPPSGQKPLLPDPSEEQGMGDILYGLVSDPEADPVEEVKEFRR